MANEGPCGIAKLENAIYMSLKMGLLIYKTILSFQKF